jgi:hypothetical protein
MESEQLKFLEKELKRLEDEFLITCKAINVFLIVFQLFKFNQFLFKRRVLLVKVTKSSTVL